MKPGYYWLAADWDNLLPGCIDCNRERDHVLPDGSVEKRGKKNHFPIANENKRGTAPGGEKAEQRLLLHPCRDFPDKALEFLEHGVVRARQAGGGSISPKGLASIRVYGLDRPELIRARERRLVDLLDFIELYLEAAEELAADPSDAGLRAKVARRARSIRRFAKPEQLYTGMCRQTIARELPELVDW